MSRTTRLLLALCIITLSLQPALAQRRKRPKFDVKVLKPAANATITGTAGAHIQITVDPEASLPSVVYFGPDFPDENPNSCTI